MSKSDVYRDYYADLGVSPAAKSEEIKSRYKKLALQYHPDRNTGDTAKFQAIQAAYEILSDENLRYQYDTKRLHASATPQTNQKASATKSATNIPTYKDQYTRRASYQPPNTRGYDNAYHAFQREKTTHTTPPWSKFHNTTRTPFSQPSGNGTKSTAPNQGFRGTYGYYYGAQQHAFGEKPTPLKKKQGFDPGTPGGDEPMARNTSSYSKERHSDHFSAFSDSASSSRADKKTAPVFSRPQSPQPDVVPGFERASHKYATASGEKTFLYSAQSSNNEAAGKQAKTASNLNDEPSKRPEQETSTPPLRTDRYQRPTVSTDDEEDETTNFNSRMDGAGLTPDPMDSDGYIPPAKTPPEDPTPAPPPSNVDSSARETKAGETGGWENMLFNLGPLQHAMLAPPERPTKPGFIAAENHIGRLVLPRQHWESYVEQICVYITQWDNFQRQTLQILFKQQLLLENGLAHSTVIADSIQPCAMSEASSGNQAYYDALHVHTKIREYWNLAHEQYQECILQVGEVREWIRTNGVQ